MLKLAMMADTKKAKEAQAEIIAVVKAWARGELLAPSATPILCTSTGASFPELADKPATEVTNAWG